MTIARWIIVFAFAALAGIVFNSYASGAGDAAQEVERVFGVNEALADSAPQQQVVAAWAAKDALIVQIRQNGVRNGLLGVCAAMLVSIAVNTALIQRRAGEAVAQPRHQAQEPPPAISAPPPPVEGASPPPQPDETEW